MSSKLRHARQQNDVKAAKTMFMTFVVYITSYIPSIMLPILMKSSLDIDEEWLTFFSLLGPFVASASNPIIYALRTRRFRYAFNQFREDPCGDSAFQEMKETRQVLKPLQLQQKKPSAVKSTGKSNEVDIQGTPLSTSNKREDHGMTSSHPDGKTSPVPKVRQNETSLHVTGKTYKANIQGTPLPRDCEVTEGLCHSERRFQGRRKRRSAEARSGSFPRVIYKRKCHPAKDFSLRANQRKSI